MFTRQALRRFLEGPLRAAVTALSLIAVPLRDSPVLVTWSLGHLVTWSLGQTVLSWSH
jgi:hypothetical protein